MRDRCRPQQPVIVPGALALVGVMLAAAPWGAAARGGGPWDAVTCPAAGAGPRCLQATGVAGPPAAELRAQPGPVRPARPVRGARQRLQPGPGAGRGDPGALFTAEQERRALSGALWALRAPAALQAPSSRQPQRARSGTRARHAS